MNTLEKRFWGKVKKSSGCWEWEAGCHKHGLPYGKFYTNGKTMVAHRVAYELTYGPVPDGLFVCHKCDNPRCVRPDHLFLGTPKDNTRDRDLKGRAAHNTGDKSPRHLRPDSYHDYGEESVHAKLTSDEVIAIRNQYARGGIGYKSLAKQYKVSPKAIQKIVRRENWKHI